MKAHDITSQAHIRHDVLRSLAQVVLGELALQRKHLQFTCNPKGQIEMTSDGRPINSPHASFRILSSVLDVLGQCSLRLTPVFQLAHCFFNGQEVWSLTIVYDRDANPVQIWQQLVQQVDHKLRLRRQEKRQRQRLRKILDWDTLLLAVFGVGLLAMILCLVIAVLF